MNILSDRIQNETVKLDLELNLMKPKLSVLYIRFTFKFTNSR